MTSSLSALARVTTLPPRSGTGPGPWTPSRSTRASSGSAESIIPNRPYADRRVAAHLDDGRSFVKTTARSYDLVTYALVDSLVLHSGYSSLRLESFLFTEEAFRDVKARLKPGGAFVMYNAFRQGWVVGRLAELAEKVFGTKPIVLSMPHVDAINPDDNQGGRVTCLLVGLPGSPMVERVRAGVRGSDFVLACGGARGQQQGQRVP